MQNHGLVGTLLIITSDEALPAFEELFLYACPKFINANSPPYNDPAAISQLLAASPTASPSQRTAELPISATHTDPAHRHLRLFLSDVTAQSPVPTLRSFLKLYTSLGSKKLANFLDADEEELVQEMMLMKQSSRCISRVGTEKGSLLHGQMITTSDLNFVIDEVGSSCFLRLGAQILTPAYFRTWSTSSSRPWVVGMPDGSSKTRNERRGYLTISAIHPCLLPQRLRLRRRMLLSQRSSQPKTRDLKLLGEV